MFSKFVNFVPIDLTIGTHIDWTYTMYIAKTWIDKNNVTYVSMRTKYPIITVPDRGGRISSYGLVSAAVIVECHGSCK